MTDNKKYKTKYLRLLKQAQVKKNLKNQKSILRIKNNKFKNKKERYLKNTYQINDNSSHLPANEDIKDYPSFDAAIHRNDGTPVSINDRRHHAMNWMAKMEMLFKIKNVSEEDKVGKALIKLSGEAFDWYSRQYEADPKFLNSTWEEFSEKFKLAYFPPASDTQYTDDFKILRFKMSRGMNISEYSEQFLRYTRLLQHKETKRFTVSRFLNGLTPEYRTYVMQNKPSDIETAIKFAEEYETAQPVGYFEQQERYMKDKLIENNTNDSENNDKTILTNNENSVDETDNAINRIQYPNSNNRIYSNRNYYDRNW